ncbi:hypothetical protein L6452_19779 [Arctium lappa]|uniref:Uncharacterized protein n=1 Tax=Arctium lappa TaxID=4217 RepID=A0ACB9B941_ARCLA|nr:hypothetical protein L6452_19779 [Arctium lappa]
MDRIEHKYVEVNGLKLHVADIGNDSSTTVVFLHGFPEIWYTWRHQMIGVADAGFRAIAPDFRGYGLSDHGVEPEKTSFSDMLCDTVAILDSLNIYKVFVIGKDFGAFVAYAFALLHHERVLGVVTLGVPFIPPGPLVNHESLPEGFYISRWRDPGRAEADFSRFDAKTVVKNIYVLFSKSEIPIANENQEIMDMVEPNTPLPSWFTEEDLVAYGTSFNKSGFRTALKVPYRSLLDERFEFNIEDPKVEAQALLIMGEKDYLFKFPGVKDIINGDDMKKYVPNLEITYLLDGSHFVQEQFPDQVNQLILKFLGK